MVIEGSFYRLTPINDHSDFFDLELLYSIGGRNPRKEFKIAGYGMPLESAIKAVIRYAISEKFGNESVTLKQYLDEFRKESAIIRAAVSE